MLAAADAAPAREAKARHEGLSDPCCEWQWWKADEPGCPVLPLECEEDWEKPEGPLPLPPPPPASDDADCTGTRPAGARCQHSRQGEPPMAFNG